MSIAFEFTMAIRYLRAKNSRFCSIMALFSIIGIALGVATLIVVMSVMNGFRAKLLDSVLGINGHINVYFDRSINSDYHAVLKSIEKIPGVLKATSMTNDQVVVAANGGIAGSVVRGVSAKDLFNNTTVTNNVIVGNVEKFDEGVIIGARLAEALNIDYGDNIILVSPEGFDVLLDEMPRMKEYKVVAIFDMGMFEYDNTLIYMPMKSAQAFFNYKDSVRNIEVFIDDIAVANKLANAIVEETGMKAESWQSQQSHYVNALKTERNVMFLILTLIIVVAAFNIVSSLMMIVQEKKSAIAIMRTFGATSGSIMRIFCACGLLIGFTGTCLGFTIGIIFSLNIENIRVFLENITNIKLFDPMIYFFSSLPVILVSKDVVNISALALFLSFLATIPPALKAAAQDPVEILRYE
ncbi:lipoprotein-releasing ABC transporter permease subunit [Wolbachia endosymbiont of Diaphorina citri]|jgi:lipoprotein releasing system, transmembrane protein, LolC/E family|uniref:lipoprotein-releasing ABC transporter permease subunit n=1 Tax=Wolbachia endosymbiont of Diaphorina citri TaxID=116598 RepID=UPI0003720CEE|nr:lipoprotein-releasing ABC transporter permease subunit [Wolbachia endosymbiont of Diaphorina citri]QJT94240.1 lipoprotein-releasing ABC transporter permease subunit [Wolbachia endosymbiont of Diaphorina citri]QJT95481.1 lipoprotein-releasing ABC transporter permease subunit [Wolbachia endosymbiont of Diaphorina citri]QJT96842.1 lipoprotein-releasing ABC transporter permease subunit [Wolbachia endosymbiont of Diaphorina citri]QLK11137.1 lipoprotein-releasing ABC transporter permease subunit [